MYAKTGTTASAPLKSASRGAAANFLKQGSSTPTITDDAVFVGRVVDNAGGCSQRKSKSPLLGNPGARSQKNPTPREGANTQLVQSVSFREATMYVSNSGNPLAIRPTATTTTETPCVSIQPPLPVLPGIGEALGAKRGSQDDAHERVCHVASCEQVGFGNMDGYPMVALCEAHLEDSVRRLICNVEQVGQQEKRGFGTNVCEYPDCAKTPRYGPVKGGPARFCKHHKKAGMFSTRNGQILLAINDGDALRSTVSSSPGSDPLRCETTPRPLRPDEQAYAPSRPAEAAHAEPNTLKYLPKKTAEAVLAKSKVLKPLPNRSVEPAEVVGAKPKPLEFQANGQAEAVKAKPKIADYRPSRPAEAVRETKTPDPLPSGPAEVVHTKSKLPESRSSKSAGVSATKPSSQEAKGLATGKRKTYKSDLPSRLGQSAPTPKYSKPSDAMGMAPSIEIKILQEEREKAAARASATGRRARVPSRKALEASGKLENEGLQWMSKEMHEERVRLRKEIKERRKMEAAVGVEGGHVLEMQEVQLQVRADSSIAASGSGTSARGEPTSGNDVNNHGKEGEDSAPINHYWRILSGAELPQTSARRQESEAAYQEANDSASKRGPESGFSGKGRSRLRSQSMAEQGSTTAKKRPGSSVRRRSSTCDKVAKSNLPAMTAKWGGNSKEGQIQLMGGSGPTSSGGSNRFIGEKARKGGDREEVANT